jgi:hypothetical protein
MRSSVVQAVLALALVGFLSLLATTLADGNPRNAAIGVGLALSPFLVWCAVRYPLLFPFGLYLAFVPSIRCYR